MSDEARTPGHPNSWPVQRYQMLSYQFVEAYRAYVTRPSPTQYREQARASGYEPIPEEVEVFLLYHALELALKGWLLLSDSTMTPDLLKDKYSHGLAKLAKAVEPYYPSLGEYLPFLAVLQRRKYAYPDLTDEGIPVPSEMEQFADFISHCGWDLFNALGNENTLRQQQRQSPPQEPTS